MNLIFSSLVHLRPMKRVDRMTLLWNFQNMENQSPGPHETLSQFLGKPLSGALAPKEVAELQKLQTKLEYLGQNLDPYAPTPGKKCLKLLKELNLNLEKDGPFAVTNRLLVLLDAVTQVLIPDPNVNLMPSTQKTGPNLEVTRP